MKRQTLLGIPAPAVQGPALSWTQHGSRYRTLRAASRIREALREDRLRAADAVAGPVAAVPAPRTR